MNSSIIGDAKYQELNMSFTFDEQQDKLIVKAIADHTPYQLQLALNPSLDFEDLKSVLIGKQFKLASKTPEVLKIKIGVNFFEFINVEKFTLNTLKETISELSNKLQVQIQKNAQLQHALNKIKVDFDSMTTKMVDLLRMNDKKAVEILNMSVEVAQLKKNENQSQEKLDKMNNIIDKNREETIQLKKILKVTDQKLQSVTQNLTNKIQKMQDIIKILLDQNKNYSETLHRLGIFKQVSAEKILYKFSQKFKGFRKQISLTKNRSAATRQIRDDKGAFALVQGQVFKKGSSIRFKIQSLGNGISGVGIAIKNVIEANSYEFKNRKVLGDGYFLICYGSWSFSHSDNLHNDVKTDFILEKGDMIKVETNVDQLLFWNQKKKLEFKMKISLTEDEWKQVCFCVTLLREGDSISILNQ